ncbi:hypothetical protein P175DRAFT_0489862 [Aspergillus ochraceoroseus IBT 24754]|uniref:Methyltransferase domain-containing protein n=2 Tax=Aspergillus ochraceoroseus TaxID=138278 RepID=A0A2T5M8A9_9EURO|nr:uncharacterized protein P175DRAFT_0489862 [Aspergillus ochraceoroseus IBT 24754]KKK12913.1 hypothetical protein AOCH_000476 [Aspergillus ochraceoroseus]PTU24769.1 hypothetical protein P175DRAFT_0489862 [Aspergillus ochraceoroseus IBT 24754]
MGSITPLPDIDFYSSPYLAEHYDLLSANETAFYTDIAFFEKQLHQIRELKRARGENPDRVVVLDVGTGTGRALHSLAELAHKSQIDLSPAVFIGFDISQDMVDRAAQTRDMPYVGNVAWRCAAAGDLDKVVADCGIENQVDLLLFADGGFLHLHDHSMAGQFLDCLSKALRPDIGRACISITNADTVKSGKDMNYYDHSGAPREYKSINYPGLVYQNSFLSHKEDGALQTSTFQLKVFRETGDGQRQLIESRRTTLKGRAWNEEEVSQLVEASSGIKVVEIGRPDHLQMFFVLQKEEC